VVDFNYRVHWAHRERQDGRHSLAEVLGWVSGRSCSLEELHRVFYTTRFGRRLNEAGYLRFRHWRLYAERGLAGEAVAVWLSGESLTVAFADEPLAQYAVSYQPDQRQLTSIAEQQLFETPYRSPQLPLWEGRLADWLTVILLPPYAPRRSMAQPIARQARLLPDELLAAAP
jgi:putative transposase